MQKQHVKMLFQRVLAKETDAFELVNSNSLLSSSAHHNFNECSGLYEPPSELTGAEYMLNELSGSQEIAMMGELNLLNNTRNEMVTPPPEEESSNCEIYPGQMMQTWENRGADSILAFKNGGDPDE